MGKIEQDEIMELAEKSRNAINDVAHLCSGEDEEHIFDMGFYSGYNKKQQEISDEEIEKASWKYEVRDKFDAYFIREAFIKGCEWYREQLKQL